jgi:hypothetical protein
MPQVQRVWACSEVLPANVLYVVQESRAQLYGVCGDDVLPMLREGACTESVSEWSDLSDLEFDGWRKGEEFDVGRGIVVRDSMAFGFVGRMVGGKYLGRGEEGLLGSGTALGFGCS